MLLKSPITRNVAWADYFGFREPITVAVTGPLARPTRILTEPFAGSSSSTSTELAA